MRAIVALALCFAAVAAVHANPQRILGGSVTTIDRYPTMTALLATSNWNQWWQSCGGTILNNRSVLTAAHCPYRDAVARWRFRVGSTWANSGGVVHTLSTYIIHPNYDQNTMNFDIALFRSASTIAYNDNVRPASIAGANYNLGDNQVVWAAGWGRIQVNGPNSEQLRHVQVWTVNQNVCIQRYATLGAVINENMLCSGWLDVGGRDQCQDDSGGPLYHNGVVIGVTSWGIGCGDPFFPSVNVRVSRATAWIQNNA